MPGRSAGESRQHLAAQTDARADTGVQHLDAKLLVQLGFQQELFLLPVALDHHAAPSARG